MKKENGKVVVTTTSTKSRFFTRQSDMRRETTKLLKFAKFYQDTKLWQKILISFGIGLIMSIVSVLFAESTGLYVGGLSSFFQGTARFTRSTLLAYQSQNHLSTSTINLIYTLLFWGQYLVVNVGLFFLAWRKIGHEFAILSLVYIVTLQAMGFAFDQIPALQNINMFGDTATVNQILSRCEVKSIVFYPNVFPAWNEITGTFDWSVVYDRSSPLVNQLVVQAITNANITRSICLILYAAVYALLHAICASILLITGSSTAGSDIISIYMSYKKNKSVGSMMLIINGIGLVLGVIIGTYCSGIVVGAASNVEGVSAATFAGVGYFFSANLIGSIVWVLIFTFGVNKFFPWKKFAKVEIVTKNANKINKHLFKIGYQHPATIIKAQGGYSKANLGVDTFVCQVVEVHKLVAHIREVDPNSTITCSIVDDLDGNYKILRHTK